MKQTRYNTFNLIHKALRSSMYDAANTLQRTDFSNREQGWNAIKKVERVLFYFDEHAKHEDNFILPAVQRYNAKLVDDFEREHVTAHALSKNINDYIIDWKVTYDEEEMIDLGTQIFYEFNEFIAFNLYHMNKEEDLLNKILWEHYTDLEILQINQALVQSIEPSVLAEQSRWMIRSINDAELTQWINGIKVTAPEHVFTSFLRMAESELPAERWSYLKDAIRGKAVVSDIYG